jgi:hypothetical protein
MKIHLFLSAARNASVDPHIRSYVLLGLALVAFIVKIGLAANTYGTNDVKTFEAMQEKFETRGAGALYTEGTEARYGDRVLEVPRMNHPPFVLRLIQFWDWCHRRLGGPLGFWLRLTCACADLFAFGLAWLLFRGVLGSFWSLAVLAVAPAAVMISGFHGNTDPIMISLVVAGAYLVDRQKPPWMAGIAFGAACSVKVWPLVLLPVFFLSVGSWRRRATFLGSFVAVTGLLGLPWVLTMRSLIVNRVFGYTPFEGWWGLSLAFPGHGTTLKRALFAGILAAAVYMHKRIPSVFVQCGIISFVFLFLTPGFGPQYLAWALPWTAAVSWPAACLFHMAAGFFLFEIYTAWSAGIPWYFANAYVYPIPGWVLSAGLLAWLLLPLLVFEAYRRNRHAPTPGPAPYSKGARISRARGRYGDEPDKVVVGSPD